MINDEILNKKIIAGRKARQDGENIKNIISVNLSDHENIVNNIYFNQLGLNINSIDNINVKSLSDYNHNGTLCIKPDISISYIYNDIKFYDKVSLKSTYAKTQVSVHSIKSFKSILKQNNVIMNNQVENFLKLFTKSNYIQIYNNDGSKINNFPIFLCEESKRRHRYNIQEINNFNSDFYLETKYFFKKYAQIILEIIISKGGSLNKDYFANVLMITNKNMNNITTIYIKNLISKIIDLSIKNDSFCIEGKERKKSGSTTLILYDGLISLQMKGSRKNKNNKNVENLDLIDFGSSYHGLQFNINGKKVKEILSCFNK